VSDWPRAGLRLVAVDAETGEAAIFDRDSGVDLVDAVAASCAVPGIWPPVSIGGRRYIDGGVRSPENADLAAGYDQVLLISPVGESWSGIPPRDLAADVAALRASGAQVALIQPDAPARAAMGETLDDLLDPRSRERAAYAGLAQAGRLDPQTLALLA
jgi:NTE family protein